MTYHRSEVGPLAIVISSRPIDASDAEWVARLVNAYNVFVSDGGPVLHSVAPSAMQRAAAEVAALERLTGARLSHEVILTSKRNSQRAHRKLAEVALKIARHLHGVITLRQLHPSKTQRKRGIGFGAVELGYQTLDKLDAARKMEQKPHEVGRR